jgi:sulfonate transport system substrate-binding protein
LVGVRVVEGARALPPYGTRRGLLAGALLLPLAARAEGVLRVGDQRGGFKSVMEAAGVLDGFPVAWSLFAAASPLIEALNAGALDCGNAGDAPFALARAAGVPVKVIAATRSSGQSTAIVVPGASPAQSFADLKGRSIGTGKGSIGHYLVLAAREKAGLKPSDIKLVFLSPADAKAALASGAIDAWSSWSQYITLAVAQDHARILLDGRGLMTGLSYEVATERAITEKRPLLQEFTRRFADALRWGAAHLDEYAATWARETGVPEDVARQTLVARGYYPAPIDAAMIADQQGVVDLYVRERVLPASQDAAAGFDAFFN